MAVRLHPDAELLVDYSSGGLGPALCVSVTAHLHFCERCRLQQAELMQIGGGLLEEVEPEEVSSSALDDILLQLDETAEDGPVNTVTVPELSAEIKKLPPLIHNRSQVEFSLASPTGSEDCRR